MDEQTYIQRVENMLYNICGCNPEEVRKILYKCLVRAEEKIKAKNQIQPNLKENNPNQGKI